MVRGRVSDLSSLFDLQAVSPEPPHALAFWSPPDLSRPEH
ncbi:hypothetical protein trd_0720 [Thermomicrobium roseum DSM 5159]|uniref:Uncharacterized protein n=1 Tax=Thermomicrobium roseum (strain ATCC 27502 / DSM 5159 / P-2) TaxID=309801 RepID=B9KZ11_THERP|nr:hypothetical protein trd_0720 [Thermomicrobium roseum DSM 5159]